MNRIMRGGKIAGSNTHLTCCGYLGPAPNHHRLQGESSGDLELIPFILSDVENVNIVHCVESVTSLQIKVDVIC